ncbi:MAG: hypothetical protein LAO07_13380 [Acidobacteriia bacterium]|nr:hypothetical protein [Terriglobia bacterium]
MVMHLMAGEAGNRGTLRQVGIEQLPRTAGVDGGHQVADGAFEVHAVATQAIVHQQPLVIVGRVQKHIRVRRAVSAGLPVGVFLLMTFLAALRRLEQLRIFQPDVFGDLAAQMGVQAPDVVEVESGIEREHLAVARRALHAAVRRSAPVGVGLPDFVAARASLPAGILVVEAGGGERQSDDHDTCQGNQHAARFG